MGYLVDPSYRSLLRQALRDYGTESFRAAETTRALFNLADVLDSLGDDAAVETRGRAHEKLLELSLEAGRRLKAEDVQDMVSFWAF